METPLPEGFTLHADGTIYGDASSISLPQPRTPYVVRINGKLEGPYEGKSSTCVIMIEVIDRPTRVYTFSDLSSIIVDGIPQLTYGVETMPLTLQRQDPSGGGTPTYFRLDSILPRGLEFNRLTGTITGTPIQLGVFGIVITPCNAAGCFELYTISFPSGDGGVTTIDFQASASTFISVASIAPANSTYTKQGDGTWSPSSEGGAVVSYGLPSGESLPHGLSLDFVTGTLSGQPLEDVMQDVNITLKNNGGVDVVSIPSSEFIRFDPFDSEYQIVYRETEMFLLLGTPLPINEVLIAPSAGVFQLEGDLPTGLVFDLTTGSISGIANETTTRRELRVSKNTRSILLYVTVEEVAPSSLSLSSNPVTGTIGAFLSMEIAYNGSKIPLESVTTVPSLSGTGLSFSVATPVDGEGEEGEEEEFRHVLSLSGSPLQPLDSPFQVTLTNGNGDIASTMIYLSIRPNRPSIYLSEDSTANKQERCISRNSSVVGVEAHRCIFAPSDTVSISFPATVSSDYSAPTSYTIEPPMFIAGLTFDKSTGVLSGTPDIGPISLNVTDWYKRIHVFEVIASNDGGSHSVAFSFAVTADGLEATRQSYDSFITAEEDNFGRTASSISLILLFLFAALMFFMFLAWRARNKRSAWERAREKRDAHMLAELQRREEAEQLAREHKAKADAAALKTKLAAAKTPKPLSKIGDIPERIIDLFSLLGIRTGLAQAFDDENIGVLDLPHLRSEELERLMPRKRYRERLLKFMTGKLIPHLATGEVKDIIKGGETEDYDTSVFM